MVKTQANAVCSGRKKTQCNWQAEEVGREEGKRPGGGQVQMVMITLSSCRNLGVCFLKPQQAPGVRFSCGLLSGRAGDSSHLQEGGESS